MNCNSSARRQAYLRSLESLPNNLITWTFVWCALLKAFIYKPVKNTISGGEKNNPVNSGFSFSFLFHFLPLFFYFSNWLRGASSVHTLEEPRGIRNLPNAPRFLTPSKQHCGRQRSVNKDNKMDNLILKTPKLNFIS